MSRLSKYVKEKIVKVLVAALVVGTVAGNEGIIAQAAEKNANIKNFLGEAINSTCRQIICRPILL